MLVGDVRWATVGFGSSWKLSGGRKASSAPTKVSKKRQVRRAVERRAWRSEEERIRVVDGLGGRLTQRATIGESAHARTNGAAITVCSGRRRATRAPPETARIRGARMRR